MKLFEGKNALVLGGTGGIGKEIALMLSSEGACVTIQGRSEEKLAETALSISEKSGIAVTTIKADFYPDNIRCNFETLLNKILENTDILCVCFGPFLQKALHETSAEDWTEVALLNYALPGIAVSSVLKPMMDKKWGRILLFGGTGTSFRSEYKTNAAYAGAKTGVDVIAQSVAACYGKYGITCNCILPGFIETEYLSKKQSEELAEKMPGGALIPKKSVVESARFLLGSPDLNGVLLKVDRGWSPLVS